MKTFFHAYWSRRWLFWSGAFISLSVFLIVVRELSTLRLGGGKFFEVDQFLLETFSTYRGPIINRVAHLVTTLGSFSFLLVFSLTSILYYLQKKDRLAALQVFIGGVGGGIMNQTLKPIFRRDRPDLIPHLSGETGFSFPSGHAMGATAVYFTLALVIAERMTRRDQKIGLLTAAGVLVLFIALSRIYLGVHYPSDVFAGIFVGSSWAFLVAAIAEEMKLRRRI